MLDNTKPTPTSTSILFRFTINYYGGVHAIYTHATSEAQARQRAYHQLAKKVGKTTAAVARYLSNTNRVEVRRERE